MLYFGVANLLFLTRYALASASRARRQFYYIILLSLFLFSAFRFQVGCDWSGYYYQYLAAREFNWSMFVGGRDPIWWATLSGIKALGLPYPVANIISSAVFFLGINVLARRQPDPLGFLVLLFPILIINMPMSSVRQGAAIGLVCVAFAAFIDRRPIRFGIWVVLAAGFHSSALIFLLLLPVATGRYTRQRLVMAGLLAIPGLVLLASGESAEIASTRYIGTDRDAFGAVFRLSILFLSSIYFFLFVSKKWKRTFPGDYSLASVGATGMVLAMLLLPVSSVIGDRFGYYLIPIQAMIFARLPFLPFKSNKALHSALPYMGLLAVFLVWTQLSYHFRVCYIPYDNWLFGLPAGSMLKGLH
ncbi:EpsG family protein [Martelella sp. FOR1707]